MIVEETKEDTSEVADNTLPTEWQQARIGDVVIKTKTRDPTREPDKVIKYIDVSSVSNTLFSITTYSVLKGADAPSRARKVVKQNDIIFATVRPTLKRVALVTVEFEDEFCSTGYCVLRANPQLVDYRFLYFSLLTDKYIDSMARIQTGASYPAVTDNQVKSECIALPPLPEQRAITRVLSTVQAAIAKQDKLIQTTQALKKALMHKVFTEGLNGESTKETEIGSVPESWEVVPLKDAVEYIDYGLSSPIPKTPPVNGVKIVSTADITRNGELLYAQIRRVEAPEKTANRLTLKDGDLLFNWRNSPELIGKSTLYHEQSEAHIFASFILRIRCDEIKTHNQYLCYLMNYFREREVFLKLARRAVNQANYNKNEISVLAIPKPTYQEQVKIADTIRGIENKVNYHRTRKQMLEAVFRTLLHELMTGQRRVS